MYGLALRLVGHPEQAIEVLQHSFVEVWRILNRQTVPWDEPDLELLRICRRQASQIVRQHGRGDDDNAAISDPVNSGTASFELLQLLQVLGRISAESRDALTAVYFDCLSDDELAANFDRSADETVKMLRKCYAELRAADPPGKPVQDRKADMLAMRQALGLASRMPTSDNAAIGEWERAFAPFGELIEPVTPPERAFEIITERVNGTASLARAENSGRKAEIWRAALYVVIAASAAILIYLALVAVSDDATARVHEF